MKKCLNCGSETTYIQKKYLTAIWYKLKDRDGFFCKKCYSRLIANPKRTKEYRKKDNARRTPEYIKKYNDRKNHKQIRFKEKHPILEENPRTGFCNICRKSIGDEYINWKGETAKMKLTHMHHINYHDDNPLKDTIELCASCHANVSHKKIEIMVI